VICEIMNDDGTMARMPDLVPFAQRHGLKIGTIEDLIAHRLAHDRIVRPVARQAVTSAFGGEFTMHVYETTVDPVEHVALVKGDLSAPGPVLVRVHAVSLPGDMLGIPAENSSIQRAMEAIEREGRGVVVLIRDLRPKAISEWLADRSIPEANRKSGERRQIEIGIGSQILRDLGVTRMTLLTNSPGSVYVGLEGHGLDIAGTRKIG
jgi:3,4-dihydroxy 2-butanone 4-phosphate synthase/GTP cyclohydrolase II